MFLNKYINKASNLFIENRLLKFIVVVLAITQVLSYCQLANLKNSERTILVPIGLNEQVNVSGKTADLNYLSAMAVYITTLKYSSTPRTVMNQYKMLLTMFETDSYDSYAQDFLLSAQKQQKNEVTYQMRINDIDIKIEPESILIINITYSKFIFKEPVDTDKRLRLEVKFEINYGKFAIKEFKEVKL